MIPITTNVVESNYVSAHIRSRTRRMVSGTIGKCPHRLKGMEPNNTSRHLAPILLRERQKSGIF